MKLLSFYRQKELPVNINISHVVSWEFCVTDLGRLYFKYTSLSGHLSTETLAQYKNINTAKSLAISHTETVTRFLNNSNHKSLII